MVNLKSGITSDIQTYVSQIGCLQFLTPLMICQHRPSWRRGEQYVTSQRLLDVLYFRGKRLGVWYARYSYLKRLMSY